MTEAEFFAKSIKDVADHYGRGLLDQKTLDWLNLIQCAAMIYGARVYAIRSNPKTPAEKPVRAEAVRATPTPQSHQPNGGLRNGEIAGVGNIEFPADHPIFKG